ncbi:guanine deaminase [Acidobacteriota bacterium]
MEASSETLILTGHLIDTPNYGLLRSFPDGAVVIHQHAIAAAGNRSEIIIDPRWKSAPVRDYPPKTCPVILSGLTDVHTHLPQFPAVARSESALLPWLDRHIFPLEKGFQGEHASAVCHAFFDELAAHGTTTAMIYAAVWEDSCHEAFEVADRSGLRIIMGKVMMDIRSYGHIPDKEPFERSLEESERLCGRWHGADGGRLEYAFSPRFAVSCTEGMMRAASRLAQKYEAYIQTHLSETQGEIENVRDLHPRWDNYASVYEGCGILGNRTVLGHCLHLDDAEINLLKKTGSRVAHCPTSNLFLNSGVFPMERLRGGDLKIGLGSDVAAGPELNLWQVMRSAVETQKFRRMRHPELAEFEAIHAFYLATMGGAEVLNKNTIIGTLEEGKDADIGVWDLDVALPMGKAGLGDTGLTAEDIIALLVYRGNRHCLLESFVRGRSVFRAPDSSFD